MKINITRFRRLARTYIEANSDWRWRLDSPKQQWMISECEKFLGLKTPCGEGKWARMDIILRTFPEDLKAWRPGNKRGKKKKKRKSQKAFYASKEWQRIRYMVLKANDGRCELCGASKKDGIKLHCDHIKPRSKYPELELEISNIQVLCEPCNLGKSNLDETDWREPRLSVVMGESIE